MADKRPILGYWDMRCLAEPIRLLLRYAAVDFEDRRYCYGTTPETLRESWAREKFHLGLDFPNLPYYIDDDLKLTQSGTILRYLGRKYGLDGRDEQERSRVDLVHEVASELHAAVIEVAYHDSERARRGLPTSPPDFRHLRENLIAPDGLPVKLAELENFLVSSSEGAGGVGPWVGTTTGDRLTYADFRLFETLDVICTFEPLLLEKSSCPRLRAFMDRFESLPPIAEYRSRPEFDRLALFGAAATVFNKQVTAT